LRTPTRSCDLVGQINARHRDRSDGCFLGGQTFFFRALMRLEPQPEASTRAPCHALGNLFGRHAVAGRINY